MNYSMNSRKNAQDYRIQKQRDRSMITLHYGSHTVGGSKNKYGSLSSYELPSIVYNDMNSSTLIKTQDDSVDVDDEGQESSVFMTSVIKNQKTQKLNEDSSPRSIVKINEQSQLLPRDLSKVSFKINLSALVVNQEPDIPLKRTLQYKTPDLFVQRKNEHLDKLTSAKQKLEDQADIQKQDFEKKIKEQKNKQEKLKELIEFDEYERNMRLQQARDKEFKAKKKLEKIDKEIEKKQIQDYKDYLTQRKLIEHEKQKEHDKFTRIKLKQQQEQFQKEKETEDQKRERIRIEEEEAEKQLQFISQKLNTISQKNLITIETMKKSRNERSQQVVKARTEYQSKVEYDEMQRLQRELLRFNRIVEKRQKVEEDRREYCEALQKMNKEKLEKQRLQKLEELKIQDQWSYSVLQKHKRQWDQVLNRNQSIGETVQAKRELLKLRFDDQQYYQKENTSELKQHQEKIIQKHKEKLQIYLQHKDKLQKMQQNQILTEMHKKREITGQDNQWFQTIKPRNKMLDISLKKIVLKDEQIIRAGGQLRNITRRPDTKSQDSDEQ
eukprot:403332796